MKGWVRFYCVLIALYNLFMGWGMILTIWTNDLQRIPMANEDLKMLLKLVLGAGLLFVFVHSVRLIMLFESARKIQLYLSGSMFGRRLLVIVIGLVLPHSVPWFVLVAFGLVVSAIDVGTFALMWMPSTRKVFEKVEKERRDKWLLNKSMTDLR